MARRRTWYEIAKAEYEAMDAEERASWADLRHKLYGRDD